MCTLLAAISVAAVVSRSTTAIARILSEDKFLASVNSKAQGASAVAVCRRRRDDCVSTTRRLHFIVAKWASGRALFVYNLCSFAAAVFFGNTIARRRHPLGRCDGDDNANYDNRMLRRDKQRWSEAVGCRDEQQIL